MLQLLPTLIVMLVLLGLSAFFSGTETALFSLTAAQIHSLKSSPSRVSHLAARLVADPESLLISLLVSNMAVNVIYFTLAALGTMQLGRMGQPAAATAMAVGALVVLVLCGEVVPKITAYANPPAVTRLAVLPMFVIHQAMRPMHRLLRWVVVPLTRLAHPEEHVEKVVSNDELSELLELSQRRGVLHADETMMLQEIVALNLVRVRDVMVPRVQMAAFDIARPASELRELFRTSRHARVPVYRRDLDHVLGWADARRVLLNPDKPIGELLMPVHYAAELATVEQMLIDFRRNKVEIAVVVDEYGGTAGLIALEDVVEEIVGDITDTQAPPPRQPVEQVGPAEYSVSGQLPIHDWADAIGYPLEAEGVSTVGGLVFKLLGRLGRVGDRVRYGNVTFVIESMTGRRIERLRLIVEQPREGA